MALLRCPNEDCLSTEFLEVSVKVYRRLIQDDPDNIETTDSIYDNSEDWDDDSAACCTNCRWTGFVINLDREDD